MSESPTFAFRGGKTYAVSDGRVIAASRNAADVELLVKEEADEKERKNAPADDDSADERTATHLVTPNGLKGKILGRHSVWGGEVTVRFANNQVATIATEGVRYVREIEQRTASAGDDTITELEGRLSSTSPEDRPGMTRRLAELDDIQSLAHCPYTTDLKLTDRYNVVRLAAQHEAGQIRLALDRLELAEAENLRPTVFAPGVAPAQPDLGGGDGGWLQDTYDAMGEQAADLDFEEILREEPALVAEGVPENDLGDQDHVGELALAHVKARIAGVRVDPAGRRAYEQAFVERTEGFRQERLANKTEPVEQRTASVDLPTDLPDEAIFLSP